MNCEHNSRCHGDCCKRFYLPLSPEELKHEATRPDRYEKVNYDPKEVEKLYDMVIPLENAIGSMSVNGEPSTAKWGWWYTCKYFNVTTGDCMNYENRPNVCRDYPFYGRNTACRYKDCTWEDGRNPPVPKNDLLRLIPIGKLKSEMLSMQGALPSSDG